MRVWFIGSQRIVTVHCLVYRKPEDWYCVCLVYSKPEDRYFVCLVYRG